MTNTQQVNVLYEYVVPNRKTVGRPSLKLAKVIELPARKMSAREKEKEEVNISAFNKGNKWLPEEIKKVKQSDQNVYQLARELGRTVAGVTAVRDKISFSKRIPE